MKNRIFLILFSLGFVAVHLFIQFYTWSIAPGNATSSSDHNWISNNAWTIFSFPIVPLFFKGFINQYFALVLVANSFTWLGAIAIIVWLKKYYSKTLSRRLTRRSS
jgi:hypothetical protein